jgi:glycosyltransferase involved in cell wall biosynthesis
MRRFPGRLALQQRVLPAYRAPFFDALAKACDGGLSVFAGQPQADEQIPTASRLQTAYLSPARNIHFTKVGSPFYQCWQQGIIAWLEDWQPEVLIVEANPRYPSTRWAVRWMHGRGKPVLGWGLGALPLKGIWAPWRRWRRLNFLGSLDGMIAYSQPGAEQYRALGFRAERVFVAPNAAASRPALPPPQRTADFAGRATLLFVGRLQRRKRLDNLLRACAALDTPLQPRLVIVGDGPARAELEVFGQEVYPQAEFTGALYGEALQGYFAVADLFVLPGSGGLAVQQAMSYALPVIVAEADGTQADLVRDENGWLIPPDDLPALIAALRAALTDTTRLRRMGVASYRIVAEEVNIEKMVEAFLGALEEVTQER